MSKKLIGLGLLSLQLVALAVPAPAQELDLEAGEAIPDSYICVFKKIAVSRGQVQSEANRSAKANGGRVTHTYSASIRGFAVKMPAHAVQRMQMGNPNIAYCEQDRVMAIPPVQGAAKPGGGGGSQPAQTTPWGITRVNGGAAGTYGTAWVIDSGIDLTHPDLNVDVARSRTFLGGTTTPGDQNGHGTHVAGTIAAKNNTIGVIGVAPGAPVVAVRVLNRRGSGSNSGVIAGVEYVAANGAPGDVANMSLGGGISQALDDAVVAAAGSSGVKFTLAAGNEGTTATSTSPGRANGPNVFTVSAFANGGAFASFSNYGNPPVDWAEPGVGVLSTYLGGGYASLSGTSMAAPHLAGILLTGPVRQDGVVSGDPDGNPDKIGVR